MTGNSDPLSGPVLPPKKGPSNSPAVPTEAFNALGLVVTEVTNYLKIRDVERSRRDQIATYRQLEIEKLRTVERILTQYFAESFKERASSLERLFGHLDSAIASGDDGAMRAALGGIVEIAKASPIAAAGDFSQIRAALDDPNHVWTF